MDPAQLIYYVLLFSAAIIVVAGWGWWQTRRASRGWRPAPGRILDADLETTPDDDARESSPRHYPRLQYEYEVDGATYHGTSWRAGDTFVKRYLSAREARAVLARYRPGRRVTVYYNPADPGESALERA
jgi:hypothetical protein